MEENSEKLSQDISYLVHDKLMKEMEYLMRVSDEREEERFKQLDEVINSCCILLMTVTCAGSVQVNEDETLTCVWYFSLLSGILGRIN